jgi:hypothetical protein
VAQLLDTRYADCERVTLVLDNLNAHTKGAFYEVFAPDGARLLETDRILLYPQARLLAEHPRI